MARCSLALLAVVLLGLHVYISSATYCGAPRVDKNDLRTHTACAPLGISAPLTVEGLIKLTGKHSVMSVRNTQFAIKTSVDTSGGDPTPAVLFLSKVGVIGTLAMQQNAIFRSGVTADYISSPSWVSLGTEGDAYRFDRRVVHDVSTLSFTRGGLSANIGTPTPMWVTGSKSATMQSVGCLQASTGGYSAVLDSLAVDVVCADSTSFGALGSRAITLDIYYQRSTAQVTTGSGFVLPAFSNAAWSNTREAGWTASGMTKNIVQGKRYTATVSAISSNFQATEFNALEAFEVGHRLDWSGSPNIAPCTISVHLNFLCKSAKF